MSEHQHVPSGRGREAGAGDEPETQPIHTAELRDFLDQLSIDEAPPRTHAPHDPSVAPSRGLGLADTYFAPAHAAQPLGPAGQARDLPLDLVRTRAAPRPAWVAPSGPVITAPAPLPLTSAPTQQEPRSPVDFAGDPEPPTLLYRPERGRRRRAAEREPATLLGLGRVVAPEAPAPRRDSRPEVDRHDQAPASTPAHGAAMGMDLYAESWRAQQRTLRIALVVMALVGSAPVIFALVARRADAAAEAVAPSAASVDAHTQGERGPAEPVSAAPREVSPISEPGALATAAAAGESAPDDRVASDAEDVAAEHDARAREAAALLLSGERSATLSALRALTREAPSTPDVADVVRLMERELRACAAQGGRACDAISPRREATH